MLGVGRENAPGIDAVDLDNVKGISLKSATSARGVERGAGAALKSAEDAGFHDVQVYIDATGVLKSEVTGNFGIQSTLDTGTVTVTKIVIFTGQGPVEYRPTEAQRKQIACKEQKDTGSSCQ